MPDVVYVGLQDDDKIVSFGIDAGAGKLVPQGRDAGRRRAVGLRGQPGPARAVCRLSRHAGHRELSHRPGQRRADIAGARLDRASADLSRHRPHRQVPPVGLLPGRVRGRASARKRRCGERAGARPAEHRAGSARDPDRPVEPLRLRATHRPAERQRPGAAEEHPRPEFHRAVSVRRGHRAAQPQRAVQARPARADRATALLLPSHARSRLFLRRAGLQCDGLPRRSRLRHPLRRGNDPLAARGCDRAQYLFADPSDAIGPVPLCRQPRPQQHRRVRRRPGDRAPDARRACADRGGPHRVRSRFDGQRSSTPRERRPDVSPRTGSTARPAR